MLKAIEKPMLFSRDPVRRILDWTKTQDRRIIKPQPHKEAYAVWDEWVQNKITNECPHPVGSRVWVKETWRVRGGREYEYQKHQPSVVYRADADVIDDVSYEWRPSIFMPRWASRITLEITNVRIERLNKISEEDAVKEGVICEEIPTGIVCESTRIEEYVPEAPSDAYIRLWESINGKGSWEKNPMVWVYEFRRLA